MRKRLIYLDYAAATPVDATVSQKMQPYFSDKFYNPSANYLAAQTIASDLAAARADVAACLGARASEIIFTAGASEANNLAVHGAMRAHGGNAVVSAIEHPSIVAPAQRYDYRLAPVQPDGLIDMAALEQLIDDDTTLVSVSYASNEVGTVQPLKEIARVIKSKIESRRASGNARPLLFHTDAAQAANYLDLQVARLGIDMMTLNGGKIYGPKQSGALYVRAGVMLEPLIDGGGQERNLRSGTENIAFAVGLAAALQQVQANRHAEAKRLQALQQQFITDIHKVLPEAHLNGSVKRRLPNNIHLTFPGADNERLLIQLDEAGIMAAAGSACSASSDEPSPVLSALGLPEPDIRSSLRFTLGRQTTEDDIDYVVRTLAKLLV